MEERAFVVSFKEKSSRTLSKCEERFNPIQERGDLNSFRIFFLINTDQALNHIVSSTLRPEYFRSPKPSDRIQFRYFVRTLCSALCKKICKGLVIHVYRCAVDINSDK